MTEPDVLTVAQGRFLIEDPWATPDSARSHSLHDVRNASEARLATSVRCYFDEQRLYILFSGEDDEIRATFRERDQPLYQEDVLEVFLAPDVSDRYYELEVNPLGTLFDARIHSPEGARATMSVDVSWNCEGLSALVKQEKRAHGPLWKFETLLTVPFSSLGRERPQSGERWRANFYRIDRHPLGDEFSAWIPTRRDPPDFHVPASFGVLRFA